MIWPRSSRLLRAPNLQPPASRTDAVQSARQYVTELGEQIQRDLVEPLNELLAARASVQDVNSLGAWFGSASRICSVLALNHRFVDLLSPLDAERLLWLVGLADHADVVDLDDRVVGFVLTMAPGSEYDSDNYRWHAQRFDDAFYYLDRIVIAEEMRRRGLAGFVYDAMEDVARRFGRMTLEVNVDPPNHGSLAFHERRGYVEVGRLGEPGHVVGLMAKELTA